MNKILAIGSAFVFMVLCSPVFASRQGPDIVIYKGYKADLNVYPLEQYFNVFRPRPFFPAGCTGGYRGYRGVWEINKGYLYLLKLQAACAMGREDPDKYAFKVFPFRRLPVKATWFSGTIYVHDHTTQKEKELIFKDGKCIREEFDDEQIEDY